MKRMRVGGLPLFHLAKKLAGCAEVLGHHHIHEGDIFEKTGVETVTIFSGRFQCPFFSTARQRNSFTDERDLWPKMCHVIAGLRPR